MGTERKTLRVLIVEDSPDDALLVLRELRRAGFDPAYERVETPDDLKTALSGGRRWDLVLSDYSMPRFRAPDALKIVRARHPDTPFVIVSGTLGEEAAVEAMKAGAQDYVMKDNLARLGSTVARELREAEARRRYREAEEALKEGEERYRAVVEQAAEGIVLVDVETKRVLETNAAYENLLGYSSEAMRFLTLYDLVPYPRKSMDCYVEKVLSQKTYVSGERRHKREDGTLVDVEVSANLISYGGREAMCIVVRDITERKRAEEGLREAREAERRRIARDMHDGALQDLSYALAEAQILRILPEEPGTERLDLLIEALRRSASGLRGAVYDLRQDEEAPGRCLVRSVESLVELNRQMNRGWEVKLAVGAGFPTELPERVGRELLRVVQEALTNARKHSGAENVRVTLKTEGDDLVAEVHDDGRGFDPSLIGAGVGTRSMRERASALGGELHVESDPGRGTRVRLRVARRADG